ncbi:hypothetical protein F4820DRAFT_447168 [Hypoxylon rubiginosum]|uniref:Uncharacterized protein n=1 Tax=Hypoxylon rubiginosum TaxID=110542 RepID=A0ACB9Z4I8_9PEZI|nr:hypothetical protein F4820DRAFT_447168 [Hypoxylon rubiginosum]
MGKHSNSSPSGSASHKTKKPRNKDSDKSNRSEMSSLSRYVDESQNHERVAISQPSDRNAGQYLQDWEKTWQAASGRKD